MARTTAAIMAVVQSAILKLFIIPAANFKTIAVRTNVNNPRVSSVIGNVKTKSIGFTSAFNKPITTAATMADLKSFNSKPFTNFEVISRAIADKIQTKRI